MTNWPCGHARPGTRWVAHCQVEGQAKPALPTACYWTVVHIHRSHVQAATPRPHEGHCWPGQASGSTNKPTGAQETSDLPPGPCSPLGDSGPLKGPVEGLTPHEGRPSSCCWTQGPQRDEVLKGSRTGGRHGRHQSGFLSQRNESASGFLSGLARQSRAPRYGGGGPSAGVTRVLLQDHSEDAMSRPTSPHPG